MEIFSLKPSVVGKLSLFSGMQNDTWMQREGLKGFNAFSQRCNTRIVATLIC